MVLFRILPCQQPNLVAASGHEHQGAAWLWQGLVETEQRRSRINIQCLASPPRMCWSDDILDKLRTAAELGLEGSCDVEVWYFADLEEKEAEIAERIIENGRERLALSLTASQLQIISFRTRKISDAIAQEYDRGRFEDLRRSIVRQTISEARSELQRLLDCRDCPLVLIISDDFISMQNTQRWVQSQQLAENPQRIYEIRLFDTLAPDVSKRIYQRFTSRNLLTSFFSSEQRKLTRRFNAVSKEIRNMSDRLGCRTEDQTDMTKLCETLGEWSSAMSSDALNVSQAFCLLKTWIELLGGLPSARLGRDKEAPRLLPEDLRQECVLCVGAHLLLRLLQIRGSTVERRDQERIRLAAAHLLEHLNINALRDERDVQLIMTLVERSWKQSTQFCTRIWELINYRCPPLECISSSLEHLKSILAGLDLGAHTIVLGGPIVEQYWHLLPVLKQANVMMVGRADAPTAGNNAKIPGLKSVRRACVNFGLARRREAEATLSRMSIYPQIRLRLEERLRGRYASSRPFRYMSQEEFTRALDTLAALHACCTNSTAGVQAIDASWHNYLVDLLCETYHFCCQSTGDFLCIAIQTTVHQITRFYKEPVLKALLSSPLWEDYKNALLPLEQFVECLLPLFTTPYHVNYIISLLTDKECWGNWQGCDLLSRLGLTQRMRRQPKKTLQTPKGLKQLGNHLDFPLNKSAYALPLEVDLATTVMAEICYRLGVDPQFSPGVTNGEKALVSAVEKHCALFQAFRQLCRLMSMVDSTASLPRPVLPSEQWNEVLKARNRALEQAYLLQQESQSFCSFMVELTLWATYEDELRRGVQAQVVPATLLMFNEGGTAIGMVQLLGLELMKVRSTEEALAHVDVRKKQIRHAAATMYQEHGTKATFECGMSYMGPRLKGESDNIRCWMVPGEWRTFDSGLNRILAGHVFLEEWISKWRAGSSSDLGDQQHAHEGLDALVVRKQLMSASANESERRASRVNDWSRRLCEVACPHWEPMPSTDRFMARRTDCRQEGKEHMVFEVRPQDVFQVTLRRMAHPLFIAEVAKFHMLLRAPRGVFDGGHLTLAQSSNQSFALEPLTISCDLWSFWIFRDSVLLCESWTDAHAALKLAGCPVPLACYVAAHHFLYERVEAERDNYDRPLQHWAGLRESLRSQSAPEVFPCAVHWNMPRATITASPLDDSTTTSKAMQRLRNFLPPQKLDFELQSCSRKYSPTQTRQLLHCYQSASCTAYATEHLKDHNWQTDCVAWNDLARRMQMNSTKPIVRKNPASLLFFPPCTLDVTHMSTDEEKQAVELSLEHLTSAQPIVLVRRAGARKQHAGGLPFRSFDQGEQEQ